MAHRPGHRPRGVLAVSDRDDAGAGDESERRLDPDERARGRRAHDRAVGLGADANRPEVRGDGGGGARARAAGAAVERVGVLALAAARAPTTRGIAGPEVGPFGEVGLPDDDGPSGAEPADDDRVRRRRGGRHTRAAPCARGAGKPGRGAELQKLATADVCGNERHAEPREKGEAAIYRGLKSRGLALPKGATRRYALRFRSAGARRDTGRRARVPRIECAPGSRPSRMASGPWGWRASATSCSRLRCWPPSFPRSRPPGWRTRTVSDRSPKRSRANSRA